MKLIIAEKNDVAKQLKNALDPSAKYVTTSKFCGYYIGKELIFCSALGHLFELAEPKDINPDYAKWSLDNLPYVLPETMPLKPNSTDKAYFRTIKELYGRNDIEEVIVATDPDREGQNIYEKIKRNLRTKNVKETRIWIKEWTEQGLKDAFALRKPNSEYNGLKLAGEAREEGDAIIGIQGTVAMSKKFGSFKNVYTVGRVQTPTLKFCYDRENEIRNFKPEPYSVLAVEIESDSKDSIVLKHKNKDRLSEEQAKKLSDIIKKTPKTKVSVVKKHVSVGCPKLYTTTDIQKEMNRLYGFSSDKTLELLQSLYQTHSLTTYPRTDKNVISESTSKIALNALKNVRKAGLFDNEIEEVFDNSWNISKSVVTNKDLPHEAITPVFGSISPSIFKSLSADEMKVYKAILSRFLQAFFPSAEFDETTVSTVLASETFETKGRINTKLGWMKFDGLKKDSLIPPMTDGKDYSILDVMSEKKMTTPPARYSEAALLDAMEHAGRFVENKDDADMLKEVEGIGTAATRASIIKGLKTRGYLELKKGVLIPTDKAYALFKYLPECGLTSPSQTARLEKILSEIVDGKKSKKEFMNEIKKQNEDFIEKIKKYDGEISEPVSGTVGSFGKCPICGAPIIENSKAYACSRWKSGCRFTVWKTTFGKKISEKMLGELLNGKRPLVTLKRTDGSEYKARLYLDSEYKLSREYENPSTKSIGKTDFGDCPNCGKQIIETESAYTCMGFKDGCRTTIWKNCLEKLGKKKINKTEAKKLLAGETISVKLKSKNGIEYTKKAYYDNAENRVKVIF